MDEEDMFGGAMLMACAAPMSMNFLASSPPLMMACAAPMKMMGAVECEEYLDKDEEYGE